MRLKSVRIYGFKTFAERTEFALEGGIVAVVGPNGCGKSNLVDAILWGLGEGNSRNLRAQSGQDVIFNGSSRRSGVGYCEVSLLFDNEDGLLPISSPEVAITRRLSRGGDSDYSINRRPCRQRDVHELLADSGLGRTGYSIVSQRQIDAALSASSEERRAWIDEAAGVQRYRQRRVEAMRKLELTREHLLRVTDIINELSEQREPLRAQAEEATKYRRIQSVLRETEIGYLAQEITVASTELSRSKEQIEIASRLLESETLRARSHEERAADIQKECVSLGASIEQERGRESEARGEFQRADAEIRVLHSRVDSLNSQLASFADDQIETAARIAEAERELERLRDEFAIEEEAAEAVRVATAGFGEESRVLSKALDEAERQLKSAQLREASRLKREAEREHLIEKRSLAKRELQSLDLNFEDLDRAVLEAKRALEQEQDALNDAKKRCAELIAEELRLKTLEDSEAAQVRAVLSERAALEGRERGIESTIDGLEGLTQGSRSVLEAAAKNLLEGNFVLVGHAIQTAKENALAIETALGGSINDLIVDTDRDSKEAINYLKANRSGRAVFQPLNLIRSVENSPELQRVSSLPRVIGIAADLVTCERKYRPVVESLSRKILVVDTLSTALEMARTKGWSRLVTLEGEIVYSSGAVAGGVLNRPGYGVLQKKADLALIRKQIDEITAKVDLFHKHSRERQQSAAELAQELKVARNRASEVEEQLSEAKSYLRVLEDEYKSTLREKERLERELSAEILEAEKQSIDIAQFETARSEALKALAAKSADAELAEQRLKESEKRLAQARLRVEAGVKRREQAVQSEEVRSRKYRAIEPDRLRLQALIAEAEKKKRDAAELESDVAQSLAFLVALKASKEAERDKENSLAAEARRTVADTSQMLHQLEISRTRSDSRRLNALARVAEEYSLSEADLVSMDVAKPPEDAPAIVSKLRKELRSMGEVNLGAIESFDRLSSRLEELTSQKMDVLGGIEEVEKSVRELDKLTRDRFLQTFADVQKAFGASFQSLFPSGVGNIQLSNPADVLSSGIEIEVTLPGKKRQPLSLLSGGEQSLCTVAFLFSLLKVKPSPLVVLDEVDAPLDGRNVERYADYLKELAKTIQFIVITHNPVTIGAASTWLGVTMQEPGVSTLILTKSSELAIRGKQDDGEESVA